MAVNAENCNVVYFDAITMTVVQLLTLTRVAQPRGTISRRSTHVRSRAQWSHDITSEWGTFNSVPNGEKSERFDKCTS